MTWSQVSVMLYSSIHGPAERKHITLGAVGLYADSLLCHAAYFLSVLLPDSVMYILPYSLNDSKGLVQVSSHQVTDKAQAHSAMGEGAEACWL